MEKHKQVHTVDNLEKQINKISINLGDISPISLKKEAERIQVKNSQKKAFFDKHKKNNSKNL